MATLLGESNPAAGQNYGIMVNGRDRVVVFDADAGTVVNDVLLGIPDSSGLFDCEITPDGSLGFVSDPLINGVWVLDLTANPPGLASGTNFIQTSEAPIDLTITHDGRFLVTGSNFNLFLPIASVDIATRSLADQLSGTSTQSIAACDDGSLVGTNTRGAAQRFTIDGSGMLALANQAGIPQFYINSVCAPGSATAVLGRTNTSFIPNGQFRSVSLPDMTTIQVLVTGGSVVDVLFNRAGDKLYIRKNQRLQGFNYDPATGAIDTVPFFDVGGMPFVANVPPGETIALHPDGSRLFMPRGGRIDVFSTTDGALLGSIEDPAIVGGGAICAQPELTAPVTLVADAGGPYSVDEGSTIQLSAAGSTGPAGATLTFEWDFDGDGEFDDAAGETPIFDATALDGPDQRTVAVRVSDGSGNEDTATATLDVLNVAPVADAGGPYVVDEGGTITLNGSASDAPADLATLVFEWDLDGDGQFDDATGPMPTFDASQLDGPATLTVSLRVSDDDGGAGGGSGSDSDPAAIQVDNVAPTLGDIAGLPTDPEAITEMLSLSVTYFDPGIGDTQTAVWDWGDGTTSAGTVIPNGDGTGTITGEHVYAEPGVYVVSVSIDDGDGGATDAADDDFIVVYDPEGGFITGGGWIESPPGAYTADPALAGSANFGFNAKYKKGAMTPTGSTEFQFQAGSLNFHSNSYQWLVVAGARAQFKGEGTVNGEAGFGFLLTAIDGALPGGNGADKFRIKIWEIATGGLVYDNQLGAADGADPDTVLTAGSIVIHDPGSNGA